MINNYLKYLEFVNEKLNKFFENQKDYICCKEGCSKCCEMAEFPYSQIETTHLLTGAMELDVETQKNIEAKIQEILEAKRSFVGEKFHYTCPFLVNNKCSVYDYRGVICRTFGLITMGKDERLNAPFCYELGLNYASVIEDNGTKVSTEKFKKLGIEQEPIAFNVSYEFLTSAPFEKKFDFEFGPKKPLIDWFEEE